MTNENLQQQPQQQQSGDATATATPAGQPAAQQAGFDEDLIKKYPRSNRKIALDVALYGLGAFENPEAKAQSVHISPHGIEFQASKDFAQGTLLKIHVALPDYWNRKQRFVEYRRVDTPDTFKILAKVVR